MNPLLQSKPHMLYSEYESTGKLKLPAPYARNHKLFIEHMLPIFAKIRLYKNAIGDKISMSVTLRNIPKDGIDNFSFADLRALIMMAGKMPRSILVNKMVENPKFGSLTPLFMYAHKLYDDIPYKDWDADDPNIDIALGATLYKALEFHREYPNIIDILPHTRKALAGSRKLIDFPKRLDHKETIEATEDPEYDIVYDKTWLIMNCQFWLAHVDIRDTKAMLLDVKTFGRIPPARDEVGTVFVSVNNLDPATCSWQ